MSGGGARTRDRSDVLSLVACLSKPGPPTDQNNPDARISDSHVADTRAPDAASCGSTTEQTPTSGFALGDNQDESSGDDYHEAGLAEASSFTMTGTATVQTLTVYYGGGLNGSGTFDAGQAKLIEVGLLRRRVSGDPHTLLAKTTICSATPLEVG